MRTGREVSLLGAALAAVVLGASVTAAQEVAAGEAQEVIASGLNGPMGVLVTADGAVWVVDTGVGGEEGEFEVPSPATGEMTTAKFGQSSRVVRIAPDGAQSDVATLPSLLIGPTDSFGGARLAMLNGTLYATVGAWGSEMPVERLALVPSVVKIEDGQVTEVADTWSFETAQNPDGVHVESNPYAIATGPDGKLWMADAAGNDLLKIDPASGEIQVVAVFDALPSPIPNPNRGDALLSDPVPTGLVVDEDGSAYVSFLPGFPFVPGSAKVVKVTADGQVSDYATGLTMLTDLRRGPDGNLYAVSIGRFTEEGPVPSSGAIVRVKEGAESEEVVSGLSFPTSIDFNAAGDAYVTINGLADPGTGELVMYKGLASSSS